MAINVAKEVATLRHMTVSELRDKYHEAFGEDTNARNKQWLIKRIAWKLQANVEGDISERARRLRTPNRDGDRHSHHVASRQTTTVTETLETASTTISPPPDTRVPLPGANIVKTYKDAAFRSEYNRIRSSSKEPATSRSQPSLGLSPDKRTSTAITSSDYANRRRSDE